jgi:aryl-alcohol dehydrogenase-like predicted oxidoreductase
MIYRRLGNAGFQVSVLGLGTNSLGSRADARESHKILDRAVEAGITLIDTANTYGHGASETVIGEWLGPHRHEVAIATKAALSVGAGPNDRGASRSHLVRELEGSLRRLKTDYVDLYQMHTFDPGTPLEETLSTLESFVRDGKVRYVGASNYRAWELMKALAAAERLHAVPPVTNQVSYSLADRTPERELFPLARDQHIGIIAYFPLASGILTGKYRVGEAPPPGSRGANRTTGRYQDAGLLALAAAVSSVAQDIGATAPQVALQWLIQNPLVTSAIAGARTVEQLEDNLGAVDITLSEEAVRILDEASQPYCAREPFSEARID